MVRTTGGARTRDLHFRQKVALSAELQRYAERKIDSFKNLFRQLSDSVDNSDKISIPFRQKVAVIKLQRERPRQKWRGLSLKVEKV